MRKFLLVLRGGRNLPNNFNSRQSFTHLDPSQPWSVYAVHWYNTPSELFVSGTKVWFSPVFSNNIKEHLLYLYPYLTTEFITYSVYDSNLSKHVYRSFMRQYTTHEPSRWYTRIV